MTTDMQISPDPPWAPPAPSVVANDYQQPMTNAADSPDPSVQRGRGALFREPQGKGDHVVCGCSAAACSHVGGRCHTQLTRKNRVGLMCRTCYDAPRTAMRRGSATAAAVVGGVRQPPRRRRRLNTPPPSQLMDTSPPPAVPRISARLETLAAAAAAMPDVPPTPPPSPRHGFYSPAPDDDEQLLSGDELLKRVHVVDALRRAGFIDSELGSELRPPLRAQLAARYLPADQLVAVTHDTAEAVMRVACATSMLVHIWWTVVQCLSLIHPIVVVAAYCTRPTNPLPPQPLLCSLRC